MNGLTPQEMGLWSSYIKSICGIELDKTKTYLIESRLAPLARECESATWQLLLDKIRADVSGKLRRKVIDVITTGETSFFRDTSPFDLLKNKIIPDLIDARRKGASKVKIPIRIWSAACSTGQETYSLAIAVNETIGNSSEFDVRICATDISDKAIAVASYAKYSRLEIERGVAQPRLERNFIRDGELWRVRDELRAMASFRTMNLLEPFSFPYRFDIVLCRNVAIYFTENDRKRLFDRIGVAMAPDGYLIIGSTESLTGFCPQYESKRYLRSVFYQMKSAVK